MPTKPSTFPTWATGGSASITTPPAPTQTNGWIPTVPAPASFWNWWMNLVGQWVEYLDPRTSFHASTLEELNAGLAAGETGELNESDLATFPGGLVSTIAAGALVADLAADGSHVYVATALVVTRYTRTGGVAGVTYTPTATGTISRVVVNGAFVVLAYGDNVECFDAETGVSEWVEDFGGPVKDVAINATRVYACGAGVGLTGRALAVAIATGSAAWEYIHSGAAATLYSIATDGQRVFVAGDASSYGSFANLRALNASNGRAATAEGAGVADTASLAWNAVTTNPVFGVGVLAVDERRLYIAEQTAGGLESRNKHSGALVTSVTLPGATSRRIAIDQDFVFVTNEAGGDEKLFALAKDDLSQVWTYNVTDPARTVTADGAAVFASNGSDAIRIARGNRPTRWLRLDPSTALAAPYRWKAIPARG